MSGKMADEVSKILSEKIKSSKLRFSTIVLLLDVFLYLLGTPKLYIDNKMMGEVLNKYIPIIGRKIYCLPVLLVLSLGYIFLKKLSIAGKNNKEILLKGFAYKEANFGVIYKNYSELYFFLYKNLWPVYVLVLIIGGTTTLNNFSKETLLANVLIIVINVVSVYQDLKKYTYDITIYAQPDKEELSELGEQNIKIFTTIARKCQCSNKEYRIIKNKFYQTYYRGKRNLNEDKYFIIGINHNQGKEDLIYIVNQSTNWDEIKYNFDQLGCDN